MTSDFQGQPNTSAAMLAACRNFSQTGEDAAPSTWALAIRNYDAAHTGYLDEPLINSSHTKNQGTTSSNPLRLRSTGRQFALLLCTSFSILFRIHHAEDTSIWYKAVGFVHESHQLGLLPQWSPFCRPAVDKLAHRPQPAPNRDFHSASTCSTPERVQIDNATRMVANYCQVTYLQGSIWLGECQSKLSWYICRPNRMGFSNQPRLAWPSMIFPDT